METIYRILIVDDEAIEREGVSFLLRKFSYPFEIFTQNNGKNALAFLRETPVDILCTDIKMPFMDGLELCDEAKALYPDLFLVLLTAYSDFDYAKRAIHVKADEYLLKPVVVEEFRAVIDSLLRKLDSRREEQDRKRSIVSRYRSGDESTRNQLMNTLVLQMEQEIRGGTDALLTGSNPLIRSAVDIIIREYSSNLTVEEIAGRLNVSRSYLSALFKEETTISVMQYITLMRMNRAEHLLRNTSMRVGEIAEAVGYHDASYFGLQFKKLYGMSPAQFRNGGEGSD